MSSLANAKDVDLNKLMDMKPEKFMTLLKEFIVANLGFNPAAENRATKGGYLMVNGFTNSSINLVNGYKNGDEQVKISALAQNPDFMKDLRQALQFEYEKWSDSYRERSLFQNDAAIVREFQDGQKVFKSCLDAYNNAFDILEGKDVATTDMPEMTDSMCVAFQPVKLIANNTVIK